MLRSTADRPSAPSGRQLQADEAAGSVEVAVPPAVVAEAVLAAAAAAADIDANLLS